MRVKKYQHENLPNKSEIAPARRRERVLPDLQADQMRRTRKRISGGGEVSRSAKTERAAMPRPATGCTGSTTVNGIVAAGGMGNWGAVWTDWLPAWQCCKQRLGLPASTFVQPGIA